MTAPFTRAFVLVDAASYAPAGVMPADVEAVRAKLLEAGGGRVALAHALTGPNDLIAYLKAEDTDALLAALDGDVRALKRGQHNYVTRTETILVTAWHGADLAADVHGDPRGLGAWVFATLNEPSPEVARRLVDLDPRVVHVAEVVGRYDVLVYLQAEDLGGLREALDVTLRRKNYFTETDTRLVVM